MEKLKRPKNTVWNDETTRTKHHFAYVLEATFDWLIVVIAKFEIYASYKCK